MSEELNVDKEIKHAQDWVKMTTVHLDDNSDDPAVMSVYATTAVAQAQIATAAAIADLASAIRGANNA